MGVFCSSTSPQPRFWWTFLKIIILYSTGLLLQSAISFYFRIGTGIFSAGTYVYIAGLLWSIDISRAFVPADHPRRRWLDPGVGPGARGRCGAGAWAHGRGRQALLQARPHERGGSRARRQAHVHRQEQGEGGQGCQDGVPSGN